MQHDSLTDIIPDLFVLLRRDGTVLDRGGGCDSGPLAMDVKAIGRSLEERWPLALAQLVMQLVRKATTGRTETHARVLEAGQWYELRVMPQRPDAALVSVRPIGGAIGVAEPESCTSRLGRRDFLRRFKDDLALAALREHPVAVAVLLLDGLNAITQVLDLSVASKVMDIVLARLSILQQTGGNTDLSWYAGPLADGALAVVIDSGDRVAIERCVITVCDSVARPVPVGNATFQITACAGISVLGADATSPKQLLAHARTASAEAMRSGQRGGCFFSDAVRLRSLNRIDIIGELREAIHSRGIRLRYAPRHDLQTGQPVAWVAYLQWRHPMRGDVAPSEFIAVAEATGLALSLSRAALACLVEDFPLICAQAGDSVRVSFGALRHHLLDEAFETDLRLAVRDGLDPTRLEVRIPERALLARDIIRPISEVDPSIQIVIDEVARGSSSLDRLAQASCWGLQLDRSWLRALPDDATARRVCRAGVAMAAALGMHSIAKGIDDEALRALLLAMGCRYGMGHLYPDVALQSLTPTQASSV